MPDGPTSTSWSSRLRPWWPALVVLVGLVSFFVVRAGSGSKGGSSSDPVTVATTAAPRGTAGGNQVGGAGPVFACTGDEGAGRRTVKERDLPAQAEATIRLIDSGGPFPYDQDGAVFQNREGALPEQSTGYYHEYTVVTPGSNDRGARRIVVGACGDLYYTDDHYDSFRLVVLTAAPTS